MCVCGSSLLGALIHPFISLIALNRLLIMTKYKTNKMINWIRVAPLWYRSSIPWKRTFGRSQHIFQKHAHNVQLKIGPRNETHSLICVVRAGASEYCFFFVSFYQRYELMHQSRHSAPKLIYLNFGCWPTPCILVSTLMLQGLEFQMTILQHSMLMNRFDNRFSNEFALWLAFAGFAKHRIRLSEMWLENLISF